MRKYVIWGYMPFLDATWDGKDKGDIFCLITDRAIDTVRAARARIPERCGVDLKRICSLRREDFLAPEIAARLKELGLELDEGIASGRTPLTNRDRTDILAFLMMKADPMLKVKVVDPPEDVVERTYLRDDKGRKVFFIGY